MATASLLNVVGDGQILFRDATDYAPAAANTLTQGTPTAVQLDLTGVASGSARQSAKADLGANRAVGFWVRAAFEFAATPTAGEFVELWWAPSQSTTATDGNPGGVSGSDSAYSGYSSNLGDSVLQLAFVGRFTVTGQATGTVQAAECGYFRPATRYGSLVVYNRSGAAFHSDMVESSVVFQPDFPQSQS